VANAVHHLLWLAVLGGCASADTPHTSHSTHYVIRDHGIPAPLTNAPPDPARGKAVLVSREANCILCHAVPETGERFFGNLAPPLSGVGARVSAAQLRLRIADPLYFNKDSIMPAYYKVEGLNRVAENLRGKPVLTAAQIEDVIAYLLTLR
jgi:sulfur-oxidizing protein SoxX